MSLLQRINSNIGIEYTTFKSIQIYDMVSQRRSKRRYRLYVDLDVGYAGQHKTVQCRVYVVLYTIESKIQQKILIYVCTECCIHYKTKLPTYRVHSKQGLCYLLMPALQVHAYPKSGTLKAVLAITFV